MKTKSSRYNKYSLRVPMPGWETLDRMKRWPSILKKWIDAGRQVRIWSREHLMYWCKEGDGYTTDECFAGVVEMREAYRMTRHCGPEKQIYFKDVTP